VLTEVEEKVFRSIVENEYSNGKLDKPVYSDVIEDYCLVPPKLIPNIIVGLSRKGLVNFTDDYLWMTSKGVNYYKTLLNEDYQQLSNWA
jgi:hypothetical protein